jgi:chromate reductase
MDKQISIAALSGSLRQGSYNTAALRACAELAPPELTLDIITLEDVELYNGDVEQQGRPPGVQRIADRVAAADAVLFASPEYNYSITGVLKNAIDWLSRPARRSPLFGKPCAMLGASPSMVGTARAQARLRDIVFYNGMPLLASSEVLNARAHERFDDQGRLVDDQTRDFLRTFMNDFKDFIVTQRRS